MGNYNDQLTKPQVHVFWKWEEARVPRGNPQEYEEDMQTEKRPAIETKTLLQRGNNALHSLRHNASVP